MAQAIAKAHRRGRPVIVGMGAHVVKVGLGPLLVDLMERGIVTALAMNGAVIIHDFELAFMGHTSEEVDAEIDSGRFWHGGRNRPHAQRGHHTGHERRSGRGESLGLYINRHKHQFPNRATSLLATGPDWAFPVTVHAAVGTDIIPHASVRRRRGDRRRITARFSPLWPLWSRAWRAGYTSTWDPPSSCRKCS